MENIKENISLAQYTTLDIGGPAEFFIEVETTEELIGAVKWAKNKKLSVTILGQGSNVLIADRGIEGLVIKNKSARINVTKEKSAGIGIAEKTDARFETDTQSGTFRGVEFKDLDYDESDKLRIEVIMDSGVSLQRAIMSLLDQEITGLQWYAGIPGTIGGAVYNNIHGGTHFLSEVLNSVKVLDTSGQINELGVDELGVDYDKSRFHDSGEIILEAKFSLYRGDVEKARFVANEWAKRKANQPLNSPGCAFANITQAQKTKYDYPTTSVGYIVEHELKMTGFTVGGAKVYPEHHNFIVNTGNATAADYLAVLKEIFKRTKQEVGIDLVPEIVLHGFEPDEIAEFQQDKQTGLRKTRNKEIKTIYAKNT